MSRLAFLLAAIPVLTACGQQPVDAPGVSVYDACDSALDVFAESKIDAAWERVGRECGKADAIAQSLNIEPTAKMEARWEREASLDPCGQATADPCKCGALPDDHPFFDLSVEEGAKVLDACPRPALFSAGADIAPISTVASTSRCDQVQQALDAPGLPSVARELLLRERQRECEVGTVSSVTATVNSNFQELFAKARAYATREQASAAFGVGADTTDASDEYVRAFIDCYQDRSSPACATPRRLEPDTTLGQALQQIEDHR